MKAVDRAAQVAGWTFLFAAAAIAGREGSPARRFFQEWLSARTVRQTVRREWDDLANGKKILGNTSGSSRVVEFLDYRCYYCRTFNDTASAFLNSNPNASIVVRLAPRPGDDVARFGALAAECAAIQGEFLRMHEFLLSTDAWMTHLHWREVRQAAQITDTVRFDTCERSPEAVQGLATDSVWTSKLKLKGTPTFAAAPAGTQTGALTTDELTRLIKGSRIPRKPGAVSRR